MVSMILVSACDLLDAGACADGVAMFAYRHRLGPVCELDLIRSIASSEQMEWIDRAGDGNGDGDGYGDGDGDALSVGDA
jgi:hypothetical protein